MEDLGKRIKYARGRIGKTQSDLANDLGVSKNTIFRWEHDTGCPNAEQLDQLSILLNYNFFKDYEVYEEIDLEKVNHKLELLNERIESSEKVKRRMTNLLITGLICGIVILFVFFILVIFLLNYRPKNTPEMPARIIEYIEEEN